MRSRHLGLSTEATRYSSHSTTDDNASGSEAPTKRRAGSQTVSGHQESDHSKMRQPAMQRGAVFTSIRDPPLAPQFAAASHNLLSSALAFAMPPHASHPSSLPLKRVAVRGDGRCLYRAIAKNIAHAERRRLSDALEKQDADALRDIAWKAICVDRTKEFVSKHIIEGNIHTYCSQMRNPMFYGGEAEMIALADILKMPISVFIEVHRGSMKNIITYGEKYKSKKRANAVRVLYVNGNHYDALLTR